jgi:hypothetical protein
MAFDDVVQGLRPPKDFATDVKLSEDASFLLSMPCWRREWGEEVTYVGE